MAVPDFFRQQVKRANCLSRNKLRLYHTALTTYLNYIHLLGLLNAGTTVCYILHNKYSNFGKVATELQNFKTELQIELHET